MKSPLMLLHVEGEGGTSGEPLLTQMAMQDGAAMLSTPGKMTERGWGCAQQAHGEVSSSCQSPVEELAGVHL